MLLIRLFSALRPGLLWLWPAVLAGATPALAQPAPPAVRWSLHSGLLVSRLRYADGRQRHGSSDGGTDYTLGRHQPQVGAALGASAALPVPPTGTNTYLVVAAQLAYNRRTLAVHAAPYGPTPPPAYDARFRYRTVDAQVALSVRHFLAPRRRLYWEAGPVLAITCQDYSRVDADATGRYAQAPGHNALLRLGLGTHLPGPLARYQLTAAYARGLISRRTQVATSEDFAELTLHYQLDPDAR
ncbi:hypothetical protein EJV47_04870 [Hymenobacter gummosus]|uniref:DUF2490 domain-containing protein n=1 Tax=Hymenobacter gummosus TaxID=1776032 RepID=A0A3S0K7R1_9BACT|nr:hypothetical protein [Hymenobacter gummosus]RTQ52352.1 hypothetical protein EJV47_04870 [Hymenobacter gummosus]